MSAPHFYVGDGVPTWVIPIATLDGKLVIDTGLTLPYSDRVDYDEYPMRDFEAALVASGEPYAGAATMRAVLDVLTATMDADPTVIYMERIGDAYLIFCSRKLAATMTTAQWQNLAQEQRVMHRPPAVEAERKAARQAASARAERQKNLQTAESQMAALLHAYGVLPADVFQLRMLGQAKGYNTLSLLLDDEPGLRAPLEARARFHILSVRELRAAARAAGLKGYSKLDRIELCRALAATVPLPGV